ncbi:VOC family protein [Legionella tunisiensis]|uniref:VOC family protein n=1 Tax=Legionella tunisiensis TaxID=1034944 RepID=UPI0002D4E559|nr:VOC family protein [Legionella tunisiensis]
MPSSLSRLDWFDNVEQRPHPWPGLNWLTAMLVVPDVKKALAFYEELFGFVPIFELPDDQGELVFARLRYRGVILP